MGTALCTWQQPTVRLDRELCRLKGRDMLTPLHSAVLGDEVAAIDEILSVCPESIQDVTIQGETALHLAVKNNQYDSLRVLVDWVIRMGKEAIITVNDDQNNTAPSLAMQMKDRRALQLLLSAGNGNGNAETRNRIPKRRKSVQAQNEYDTKETRRLLVVSNGVEIFVLDMKFSRDKPKSNVNVDPLPILATLNLVDEQLPVSVGLSRLGSHVYMIGGVEFPPNLKSKLGHSTSSMRDKYHEFFRESSHKGTSSATYRLSFAAGTLTASKCNDVMRLKSPKFWPIVDEVDGKIHVFDSAPGPHFPTTENGWRFSHEVLDGCESRREISDTVSGFLITSHLVVGNCIFAVLGGMSLRLDSVKLEWEIVGKTSCSPLSLENVWDILKNGYARCVEKIHIGGVDYYLVIALVCWGDLYTVDAPKVSMAAFLVTLKGDVVCTQILHNFFKGPVQPLFMISGAIIKSDTNTQGGKTMCAIVIGSALCEGAISNAPGYYLFSNTFTVELAIDAAHFKVPTPGGALFTQKLVRVDIRGRCIYRGCTIEVGATCGRIEACLL